MPKQVTVHDTATGETDTFEFNLTVFDPSPQLAGKQFDKVARYLGDPDLTIWEAWGFEPTKVENNGKVLKGISSPDSYWGVGHTITITIQE